MSDDLSVDAAIQSLLPPEDNKPPIPDEVVEAPEAAAEPEETPSDATEEGAQVEPDEAGDEGEEQEAAEPEKPVDPPLWWKADAKAEFAKLPPELQAVVHEQEAIREQVVTEAKAKAAEATKAAQREMEGVQTLARQLNEFLPQALETFQSRWGAEPDWAAVVQQRGADEAFILKAQWENEQRQIQQLAQVKQQAEQQAHIAFVRTEFAQLAEIAPELAPDPADPTKGADKRTEVTKYLIGQGIPEDAIRIISAREMALARKAQLYDQLQANAKAAPKPKPKSPAPVAVARSSAAPVRSPNVGPMHATNKFREAPSIENAVALLLSKGQ